MECNVSYIETYERTQYEKIGLEFSRIHQVEARYIHAIDPVYQGNRLIEALPPMRSWKQCNEDFEKLPEWTPAMRKEEQLVRYQLADHLSDFRITREVIPDIDMEIHSALMRCYKQRIPYDMPGSSSEQVGFYKTTKATVPGALILGDSGAGKTTAVLHALSYIPQLIVHEMKNARMYQIPYINVSCSPDGSVKTFFDLCIEELERITGEIFYQKAKATADDKARLFRNLALRFNIGAIIVDEIQNLLKAKNRIILNQFLMLSNDLSIPFIFVGTNQVLPFLKESEFFTQRRIGREIHVNRFQRDVLWDDFLNKLWEFQWTRKQIPLTSEMNQTFYEQSGGIIDRAIELYRNSQKKAIQMGIDEPDSFTPDFVRSVSETDYSLSSEGLQTLALEGAGTTKKIPNDLRQERTSFLSSKSESLGETLERTIRQRKVIGKSDKNRLEQLKFRVIENVRTFIDEEVPLAKIEKGFYKVNREQNALQMDETQLTKEVLKTLLVSEEQGSKKSRKKNVENSQKEKTILYKEDFPIYQGGVL